MALLRGSNEPRSAHRPALLVACVTPSEAKGDWTMSRLELVALLEEIESRVIFGVNQRWSAKRHEVTEQLVEKTAKYLILILRHQRLCGALMP
jgi:hypothetical protein